MTLRLPRVDTGCGGGVDRARPEGPRGCVRTPSHKGAAGLGERGKCLWRERCKHSKDGDIHMLYMGTKKVDCKKKLSAMAAPL